MNIQELCTKLGGCKEQLITLYYDFESLWENGVYRVPSEGEIDGRLNQLVNVRADLRKIIETLKKTSSKEFSPKLMIRPTQAQLCQAVLAAKAGRGVPGVAKALGMDNEEGAAEDSAEPEPEADSVLDPMGVFRPRARGLGNLRQTYNEIASEWSNIIYADSVQYRDVAWNGDVTSNPNEEGSH